LARLPRLIIPSQAHYVVLGGNAGAHLFQDRADFERMFNIIYEQAVREDVLVHAYSLLTSQVHLMLTPKTSESLSKMMQSLGRTYVRYFNNRYYRTGTLWAGRYKSSIVESGEWLKKCLIYMDYLPVRSSELLEDPLNAHSEASGKTGGTLHAPRDYEWSSHLHYIGLRNDALVTAHADIWNLGNTPFAREEQYAQLVVRGISVAEIQHIEQSLRGGWILGNHTFIEHIQRLAHRRVAKAKPGRPAKLAVAPTGGARIS